MLSVSEHKFYMAKIEVIYISQSGEIFQQQLDYWDGITVNDVIRDSGLMQKYPEIKEIRVGVFAKEVSLDTPLKSGDRVEIYRPLLIDPKDIRRQRAKKIK